MFQSGFLDRKKSIRMALAATLVLLPVAAANASTVDYTLSGVASGTIAGTTNATFTDASFSVNYTGDPSTIVGGAGFLLYNNVNASFTEGAYSTTLTDVSLEVNGNGNTGSGAYETFYLFSTDFSSSLGINSDPALLGYAFGAPFTTGSVTGANIGAFQDVAGFSTTTGDVIEFTGVDSLDFSAANPNGNSPVPEPSSWALLLTGLVSVVLLSRRIQAKGGIKIHGLI